MRIIQVTEDEKNESMVLAKAIAQFLNLCFSRATFDM